MAIDRDALLHSAEKLLRQGKLDQAIAEYRRALDDQPRDWTTANALGDLYLRAGQIDKAVDTYLHIAESLGREGFLPKAGALYKKILKIRPHDEHVLLQAAEVAASQGLLVDARAYLKTAGEQRRSRGDGAGVAAITIKLATLDRSDVEARLAGAMAQAEIGELPAAVTSLKKLAADLNEPERLDQALMVLREAERLAPTDLEVKISLIRILSGRSDQKSADEAARLAIEVADAAVARADWASAVAELEQTLKRSPNDIAVLMRLVEISVDGRLKDVATSAQSRLADAHLRAGSALEARFIAEDLVARHPQDPEHVERLRRALTMCGEANPEAVIAARLSRLELVVPEAPDVQEPAAPAPTVIGRPEPTTEVDLSGALEGMKFPQAMPQLPPAVAQPSGVERPTSKDLDDVFADLRAEATRRVATNNPEHDLAAGLAFHQAGQLDFAVPRLEAASHAPAHRFVAAATLGRIFLDRGDTWRAIECLERAAEALAPTPADGHRLLYELAEALEGVGEMARALAICLELRAEAGDYRDLSTRIDRLAKVQARG